MIRSWLLELAEQMLDGDPTLQTIQPYVEDSGEGRWTVAAAMEENVPVPVIAASLFARFESRDPENFSARFLRLPSASSSAGTMCIARMSRPRQPRRTGSCRRMIRVRINQRAVPAAQ